MVGTDIMRITTSRCRDGHTGRNSCQIIAPSIEGRETYTVLKREMNKYYD